MKSGNSSLNLFLSFQNIFICLSYTIVMVVRKVIDPKKVLPSKSVLALRSDRAVLKREVARRELLFSNLAKKGVLKNELDVLRALRKRAERLSQRESSLARKGKPSAEVKASAQVAWNEFNARLLNTYK